MRNKTKRAFAKILLSLVLVSVCFASVFALPASAYKYKEELHENNELLEIIQEKLDKIDDTLNKNNDVINSNSNQLDKNTQALKRLKTSRTLDKINRISSNASDIVSFIINMNKLEEDPDAVDLWSEVGINFLVCYAGYYGLGSLAEETLGIFEELTSSGSASLTEVQILTDEMMRQFDKMSDQMYDIQAELASLSNHVTETADQILLGTQGQIDNLESKQLLRDFMMNGADGFSYLDFSNYLYATNTLYTNSNEAYYLRLMEAIAKKRPNEEIKGYQDRLFTALYENMKSFNAYYYGEVIGMENTSISMHYYDYLAYNESLLAEDTTAEIEALNFALDVYATYQYAYEILKECYAYQELWMLGNDTDIYTYCEGKAPMSKSAMDEELAKMEQALSKAQQQAAKDIAYILHMGESYTVQHTDGSLYELSNLGASFGNLAYGQVVYLNKMVDGLCTRFYLDIENFHYYVNNTLQKTTDAGIIKGDEVDADTFTVTVKYNNAVVYQIDFTNIDRVNNDPHKRSVYAFSGGDGSREDPYLISNAEQFYMLADYVSGGYETEYDWETHYLNAHYKLIADIVTSGVHSPIGTSEKPFQGTFDGNGYSIIDLQVESLLYDKENASLMPSTGVFGTIGQGGVVKNLTVKALQVISDYKKDFVAPHHDQTYYSIGGIAGENYGVIYNSHILPNQQIQPDGTVKYVDSLILVERLKEGSDSRMVSVCVGGIVGNNYGIIEYCSVNHLTIETNSSLYLYSESTSKNKHSLYVGGIAGVTENDIRYCRVGGNTSISAYAKSIADSKDKKNPYVTVCAGGIIANSDGREFLSNVYSACVIERSDLYVYNEGKSWGTHRFNYDNTTLQQGVYYPTDQNAILRTYYYDSTFDAMDWRENEVYFSEVEELRQKDEEKRQSALQYMQGKTLPRFDDPAFTIEQEKSNPVHIELYDNTCRINEAYLMAVLNRILGEEKETINVRFLEEDGDAVDGYVVGYYGLDTYHESEEATQITVRVLFYANDTLTMDDIVLSVKGNEMGSTEIKGFYSQPIALGTSLEACESLIFSGGFMVVNTYTNGQREEIFINDKSLVNIEGLDTSTPGEKTLKITYNGRVYEQKVTVRCEHRFAFSEKVEATCVLNGYEIYKCTNAGCEQTVHKNYTTLGEHTYVLQDGKKATCGESGYTEEVSCSVCGVVFENKEWIQALPHSYISSSDERYRNDGVHDGIDYHYCVNGGDHYEPHQYTVRETVDENGTLVYIYSCFCGYENPVPDDNIKTDEKGQMPLVFINNGYVLDVGDVVVLYVQILNNPGFIGASFGIRYTDGLELLSVEESALVPATLQVNTPVFGGYNFLWANESVVTSDDGYLLKLTFRYVSEKKTDQSVSVVYGMQGDNEGGFYTADEQYCKFMTQSGTVSVVDHLPGDVDGDGDVDIMDATRIAWSFVGKKDENGEVYSVDIRYADVNLDGKVNLVDVIDILQAISGRYGTNLLSSEYRVFLEMGGFVFDEIEGSVSIKFYDEGGNRTKWADHASFEEYKKWMTAEGYTFVGWFTRLACTCTENCPHTVDIDALVEYDDGQVRQTLYARFVRNRINFDTNGATSETPDDIVFGSTTDTLPVPELSYKIEYYLSGYEGTYGEQENYRIYKRFEGWYILGTDTKVQTLAGIGLSEPNIGVVTLVARWSDFLWETPEETRFGYDSVTKWYYRNSYIPQCEIVQLDDETVGKILQNGSKLYGKGNPKEYKITYENIAFVSDFVLSDKYTIETEEFLKGKTITRSGYTFLGWYHEGMKIESLEELKALKLGDVTLRAKWKVNVYTVTVVGIDPNSYEMGALHVPNYKEKDFISKLYFTYGDEETGIVQGFYRYYENDDPSLLSGKLDADVIAKLFKENGLDTNFTFGGLYYGGIIRDNGHSYADVENKIQLTLADGTLTYDFLTGSGIQFGSGTGTVHALILPKKYTVTLDINSGGLLENVYSDGTDTGNKLNVSYDASRGVYTLTPTGVGNANCVISQYVYLKANTLYQMHMTVSGSDNAKALKVSLGKDGDFTNTVSFDFGTDATVGFTVPEDGKYLIRFENTVNKTLTVSNFWIARDFTRAVEVYYNEIPSATLVMPEGVYYVPTGYTSGIAGSVQYFDASGKAVHYYDISGDATLYCQWEQRYSGTYIRDEAELKRISSDGVYHIINDIALKNEWDHRIDFAGLIDGHNHTISGLKIIYESDKNNYGEKISEYGFFRTLKGTIQNLTFKDAIVNIVKYKDDISHTYVGVVCGVLDGGILTNVQVLDTSVYAEHFREVSASDKTVATHVGGLVGYMASGSISDCSIGGTSTVYGKAHMASGSATARCYVGGIAGSQNYGTIQRCEKADSVSVSAVCNVNTSIISSANSYAVAGGIVGCGYKNRGTVVDCKASATNVSTTGSTYASNGEHIIVFGAIVGYSIYTVSI